MNAIDAITPEWLQSEWEPEKVEETEDYHEECYGLSMGDLWLNVEFSNGTPRVYFWHEVSEYSLCELEHAKTRSQFNPLAESLGMSKPLKA